MSTMPVALARTRPSVVIIAEPRRESHLLQVDVEAVHARRGSRRYADEDGVAFLHYVDAVAEALERVEREGALLGRHGGVSIVAGRVDALRVAARARAESSHGRRPAAAARAPPPPPLVPSKYTASPPLTVRAQLDPAATIHRGYMHGSRARRTSSSAWPIETRSIARVSSFGMSGATSIGPCEATRRAPPCRARPGSPCGRAPRTSSSAAPSC